MSLEHQHRDRETRAKALLVVPLLALAGLIATTRALAQDPTVAPADQYRALLQEFRKTARSLYEATTDEQRGTSATNMAALSQRFLSWAESNANHAMAPDCLVHVVIQELWLENNTAFPGRQDSLQDRAITLLLQNHIDSAQLADGCTRMSFGFGKQCETFLRTVLARSPRREVQGVACLRLAQFLHGRLRRLDLLSVQPETTARYERLFGKAHLDELRRLDRTAAMKEIETIFERAASEFGDVKLPYDLEVGQTARSELHEIRHLCVGKQAPELEGQDQHGEPVRLGDYRGKVVLLYFWSEH
ncbi:MAG TPA: redoxin domain-containing protein [Planctomycetota bacterium]